MIASKDKGTDSEHLDGTIQNMFKKATSTEYLITDCAGKQRIRDQMVDDLKESTTAMTQTVDVSSFAVQEILQIWKSLKGTPCWLSSLCSLAYLANFYYHSRRDYETAVRLCDDVADIASWSFGNNACETVDRRSSPLLVTRRPVPLFDAEIRAAFGYIAVCRSLRVAGIDDFEEGCSVVAICPTLFCLYVRARCLVQRRQLQRQQQQQQQQQQREDTTETDSALVETIDCLDRHAVTEHTRSTGYYLSRFALHIALGVLK